MSLVNVWEIIKGSGMWYVKVDGQAVVGFTTKKKCKEWSDKRIMELNGLNYYKDKR